MHGINNGVKEPTQLVLKFQYQSNIDAWWVSQDESITVHTSDYLGQYHSNTIVILGESYLGMQVLHDNWVPNGIKIKNILK